MVTDDDGTREREVVESEKSIIDQEPWRSTGTKLRGEYVGWAARQHLERQEYGIAKYGPVAFQGDPIDQGIEENLDQLFYLYWAKRHLAHVEGERNIYRHLLEAVMEFGLTEQVYEDIMEKLNG